MSRFIKNKNEDGSEINFSEHHNFPNGERVKSDLILTHRNSISFLNKDLHCVEIKESENKGQKETTIHTHYYIGVDWLIENDLAIYVEPKLNSNSVQTNYLKMLFSALKHPDVSNHTKDLFEIKFDKPFIEIESKKDLLTPLLMIQFLQIVKEIVRKGLKKSYYRIEKNLNGRIKGKLNIPNTIKQNIVKNRFLKNYCSYDEFGFNGFENRLLKKAIIFIQRYLPLIRNLEANKYLADTFNYILPAFENISEEVNLNDIKHSKINAFYREYAEGLRLAKIILKRFGYNIANTEIKNSIKIPPFWIDMSKLFELYVLGKLKDKYAKDVLYGKNEVSGSYGWLPDFLVISEQKIIDTKYKPYYKNSIDNLTEYHKENIFKDIRQLSGYARDIGILRKFGFANNSCDKVIVCLIIYPDQTKDENLFKNPISEIDGFLNFYKMPIKLPEIPLS